MSFPFSAKQQSAELDHFTLLFCRGQQWNVQRFITHVHYQYQLPDIANSLENSCAIALIVEGGCEQSDFTWWSFLNKNKKSRLNKGFDTVGVQNPYNFQSSKTIPLVNCYLFSEQVKSLHFSTENFLLSNWHLTISCYAFQFYTSSFAVFFPRAPNTCNPSNLFRHPYVLNFGCPYYRGQTNWSIINLLLKRLQWRIFDKKILDLAYDWPSVGKLWNC